MLLLLLLLAILLPLVLTDCQGTSDQELTCNLSGLLYEFCKIKSGVQSLLRSAVATNPNAVTRSLKFSNVELG